MEKGICALMITRNEALSIEKALNSLSGIVDQIVMVDTGSVDETLAVARAHPLQPEVYETTWTNDFSAARNMALTYCRYTWCLVLDADEYIDETCQPAVRELIEKACSSDPRSLYAPLIDNLNGSLLRNNPRIFTVRQTLKYRGRVHEYLSDTSDADVVSLHDIVIKHTGYLPDISDQNMKHQRNLQLLRRQMEDEPHVYRWKYFILRYIRIPSAEALAVLEEFGRLSLPFSQNIEVYALNAKSRLIHYYLAEGEWAKAHKQATELYAHYQDYDSTLLYICASLYFSIEQLKITITESETHLSRISELERDPYLHEITDQQMVVHLWEKISDLRTGIIND